MRGVVLASGEQISQADHVILAIGHSARDTFEMLHARGVYVEAKPFSIGCRIEHPQSLIDRARYGPSAGHPLLGAADYKLVHHAANGRSVYSFCMCPGGTVVAAASEPGRVVTNGMSQYSRDERNANSAIVVGITPDDYPGGPLAGIAFQRHWEERAFALGGSQLRCTGATGRRLPCRSRVNRVRHGRCPRTNPACTCATSRTTLPDFALAAMREAMPAFARQIRGFDQHDADADRHRNADLVADPHQAQRR